MSSAGRLLTGLDRLSLGDEAVVDAVRGKRVGLLAHPASVTRSFTHAVEVVRRAGADLRVLFGPEHGFLGTAQDMIPVEDEGAVTREAIPVHTLYGSDEASLSPTPASLADLDLVIVDLVDVGARYYTFVWTAALMLRAAAKAGVATLVLDRPNPLGGVVLEGAPQRPGYRSFVGLYDVPVRHGMTIGEIARMVLSIERLDEGALQVVAMRGWQRELTASGNGLPWVLPSPNMPTLDTARVYPGGCLLEGTTLSEGRGTTRPFEIFGAPSVDGAALARDVGPVPGAFLRPLAFEPTFHKHQKKVCGGVQVHVTDERAFRSYPTYLRILFALKQRMPDFGWRADAYEFVRDRPAFDLLTGGPEARAAIESGDRAAFEGLLAEDQRRASAFDETRRSWLLY